MSRLGLRSLWGTQLLGRRMSTFYMCQTLCMALQSEIIWR